MTDFDPAAIMAEPLTDVQLRAIAYAAPMFDAGSEEWLMRILRSVQRQAIAAHRDRLAAENAALREQIQRAHVALTGTGTRFERIVDALYALDADQPKPGDSDNWTNYTHERDAIADYHRRHQPNEPT